MAYDKKTGSGNDALLSEIRAFKERAESYWSEIYDQGREDKEFVTLKGAQWDEKARKSREIDNIPCLEINLVRTFCRQQNNIMRQNRPQGLVLPVDSHGDVETAKILQGLVKDTETATDAESAEDLAAESAVYGGLGFYRIITDYVSPESFQQEPKFMPIPNPEAVLIDPLSKALDGSDMRCALVAEWVDKDAAKKLYGDDVSDFESKDDWQNDTDKTVCIAEYFWIDESESDLVLLADGRAVWADQMPEGGIEVKRRKSARRTVKWAKASGAKVLERGEFVGEYIPILPIYGEVTWIGNKRHVFSLVHFAKDPQRLFNYWKSTEAHQLSQLQDAPWLVDSQAIEGVEDEWANPAGRKILRHNSTDENGNALATPSRIGFPTSPTGVLNAAMGAQQNITDILNMHAPVMGASGNETSGVAIRQRQQQSETAQFHLQDNMNKTKRHATRILLGCYRALYDTQIVKRILGADGEASTVELNKPPSAEDQQKDVSINGLLNDITVGRYDVVIDTSPSYATMREQSFAAMSEVIKTNPQLMQVFGDLWLKDAPLINSKEIAQRIAATIPPEIKGATEKDGDTDPQVKQIMAQFEQQMQQLQAALQEAQAAANDKQAERELKYKIELLKAENALDIAQVQAASRSDVEELRGAVEMLKQQMTPPPNWMQAGELAPQVEPYAQSMPMQDVPEQQMQDMPPDDQMMMQQDPPSAGFSLPEIQDFNAPDDGQIGMDAPQMAAVDADLSQPIDMPEM